MSLFEAKDPRLQNVVLPMLNLVEIYTQSGDEKKANSKRL